MAGKRKREPDWTAIRTEYLAGVPRRDLVAKYGINDATLKSRIYRERWSDEQDAVAAVVQTKLPDRVAATLLDEAERVTRLHLEDLAEARSVARNLLTQCSDPGALKDWAAAYKSIQSCQRLALGMDRKQEPGSESEQSSGLVAVPADSADWRELIDG